MATDSERELNVDAVGKPEMPALQQLPKAEEAADKPLHALLSNAIVTVYVGSEGVSYPLHEKLLCYHSPVLRRHFYAKHTRNTSYGLEDEEPETFDLLLGFLYGGRLPEPHQEADVGPLLDLYLLAERLGMQRPGAACVEAVRTFYQGAAKYPSLRRVQYIYDRMGAEDPMREMLVGSVARDLALGDGIPSHWAKALGRNGPMAVDIIRAIQDWHLESRSVPDVREALNRGNHNHTSASYSKVGGGSDGGVGSLDDLNGEADSSKLSSPEVLSS